MKLLDLFCGAGGAAMGYHRAGFEVVGVDINPQPRYPFEFHQADAFEYLAAHGHDFDVIHASPPCQGYSQTQRIWKNRKGHPKMINELRDILVKTGKPFVIENVKGSELNSYLMLCGTMFGLRIIKHRYFECNFNVPILTPACNHVDVYDPWHTNNYRGQARRTAKDFREAMGIDWIPMSGGASRKRGTSGDLSNAIPPAYTEWIGAQLMAVLT